MKKSKAEDTRYLAVTIDDQIYSEVVYVAVY